MLKLITALLFAALLPAGAARAQAPIVIHHIGPLTGVLAASNKEALDAAQLYLDAFNARGGVQGRPVKLERLDDGQDPKRTKAIFDNLVAEKKLLAVLMPRTTPSAEALLPGATAQGIPIVAPHSGGSFVNDPPKREVFPMRAGFRREAMRAIELQHSLGVRSFGLLLADDVFGRDTMVAIEATMKELKLTPVVVSRIDNRKPDVTEAVNAALAKRPEVELLIVSSKAAADFIRGYRKAGGRATFVSLSNTSNKDYIDALGDQVRGPIVMQVMPSPFSGVTALAREYGAAAKAKNLPLSYAGQFGWAAAKMLSLGLQRAGREPTPVALTAALEGLGDFDLGGYRVRYGPGDRTGSNFVEPTIVTIDGRFMR
jgi:ABC-type branched-subunit amino acid transport system substrate-binding protein